MKDKRFVDAYNSIPMDGDTEDRIWARLMEASPERIEIVKRTRNTRKVWRTLLLAAVIASLMGATAYAAGFVGKEALVKEDTALTPQKTVVGEDGLGERVENPEGGFFSITQPQALPEDIAPSIREKVENTRAAWAEWDSWRKASREAFAEPEVFVEPGGTVYLEVSENDDGSYAVSFYSMPDNETMDERMKAGLEWEESLDLIETRTASAEEYDQWEQYQQMMYGPIMDGYDHYYNVRTPEEGEKIKEIAAKYGLALRGEQTVRFGSSQEYYQVYGRFDWMTDEQWEEAQTEEFGEPTADILAALSAQCCRGDLFAQQPLYSDHLYWYTDGTFAVAYTERTPSGKLVDCYAYNSMYGTLASGTELLEEVEDVAAFRARTHTAPDGTVLTVLESGHRNVWDWHDESYAFVYLEDSFFVLRLHNTDGLTEEEVNAILDSIQYTNINR